MVLVIRVQCIKLIQLLIVPFLLHPLTCFCSWWNPCFNRYIFQRSIMAPMVLLLFLWFTAKRCHRWNNAAVRRERRKGGGWRGREGWEKEEERGKRRGGDNEEGVLDYIKSYTNHTQCNTMQHTHTSLYTDDIVL